MEGNAQMLCPPCKPSPEATILWQIAASVWCVPFLPAVAHPNGWNGAPQKPLWEGSGFSQCLFSPDLPRKPISEKLHTTRWMCPSGWALPAQPEATLRPAQIACVIAPYVYSPIQTKHCSYVIEVLYGYSC